MLMYVPPTASLKWIRFFQLQPLLCFCFIIITPIFICRVETSTLRQQVLQKVQILNKFTESVVGFSWRRRKKTPSYQFRWSTVFFPRVFEGLMKDCCRLLEYQSCLLAAHVCLFFLPGFGASFSSLFFLLNHLCLSDLFLRRLIWNRQFTPTPHPPPFSSADAEAELSTIRSHSSDGFFKRLPYSALRHPH